MQRHTLAANRVIGQLSRYQQDANQDPEAARTDPVPGMLQELVNENFFGFLDQLSRAPRVRNLLTNAARDEIIALYDERFFRMWQFYLAGAEAAFRYGGLVNYQVQYLKRRDAIPMTRDFMFEEELRLRGAEEAPEWHIATAAQ